MTMSKAEAQLEIGLLNAQAVDVDPTDIVVILTNRGIPSEVVTRLRQLYAKTQVIAGEVIQIGKIILIKIWDFIQSHPNLAIGAALGAAVGALAQMIPFIGPLIAPITIALGASFGAIAGHRLDKSEQGKPISNSFMGTVEDIITIAKEFFMLFASIMIALKEHFTTSNVK